MKNLIRRTLVPLAAGSVAFSGCALYPGDFPGLGSAAGAVESRPTTSPSPTPAPSSTSVPPTPTLPPSATPSPTPTPLSYASGPFEIGYSVAGRPLEMYRFGTGPISYMIVAGIHGGYEWNTTALAEQLIEHLGGEQELIPERLTLYMLPSLNPDGLARSQGYEGRANESGVDLNRNWPAHWQADWPKAGCWNFLPISGGSSPGSEPEVVWLMDFILRNEVQAIISYHSAALGIFPGGQPALPESVALAEALAQVAPYPYPPLDYGCVYTGQFTDWAAQQGIPAVDVELTNHYETDFEINLRVLEAFVNWRP